MYLQEACAYRLFGTTIGCAVLQHITDDVALEAVQNKMVTQAVDLSVSQTTWKLIEGERFTA